VSRYRTMWWCFDMDISKTDNGQCWRIQGPRDNRLIREADGIIGHVRRWTLSDVNLGGIRVSRRVREQNGMFDLIHICTVRVYVPSKNKRLKNLRSTGSVPVWISQHMSFRLERRQNRVTSRLQKLQEHTAGVLECQLTKSL
jgi:hypothetical protein